MSLRTYKLLSVFVVHVPCTVSAWNALPLPVVAAELLNFVLLSLMSGCIFILAQLMLFYVPVHIMLHEPFIIIIIIKHTPKIGAKRV